MARFSPRSSSQRTGPTELHRQPRHQDLFGVDVGLRAEPAADLGRDHPHLVLAQAEDRRDLGAHDVRELGARVDHQAALAAAVFGQRGAALHRQRGDALIDDAALDDLVCPGERGIHVAAVIFWWKQMLVPRLVDQRRAVLWRPRPDRSHAAGLRTRRPRGRPRRGRSPRIRPRRPRSPRPRSARCRRPGWCVSGYWRPPCPTRPAAR